MEKSMGKKFLDRTIDGVKNFIGNLKGLIAPAISTQSNSTRADVKVVLGLLGIGLAAEGCTGFDEKNYVLAPQITLEKVHFDPNSSRGNSTYIVQATPPPGYSTTDDEVVDMDVHLLVQALPDPSAPIDNPLVQMYAGSGSFHKVNGDDSINIPGHVSNRDFKATDCIKGLVTSPLSPSDRTYIEGLLAHSNGNDDEQIFFDERGRDPNEDDQTFEIFGDTNTLSLGSTDCNQ